MEHLQPPDAFTIGSKSHKKCICGWAMPQTPLGERTALPYTFLDLRGAEREEKKGRQGKWNERLESEWGIKHTQK